MAKTKAPKPFTTADIQRAIAFAIRGGLFGDEVKDYLHAGSWVHVYLTKDNVVMAHLAPARSEDRKPAIKGFMGAVLSGDLNRALRGAPKEDS